MRNQEKIFVIGHKNPDTDSICSAIAYADIKNRTSQKVKYIPKRAGQINEETEYVLNRFGMQPPGYLSNIGTQIKDMDIRMSPEADKSMSLKNAWDLMMEKSIVSLPIRDREGQLEGLITIGDIAKTYMDTTDSYLLSRAKTQYRRIAETIAHTNRLYFVESLSSPSEDATQKSLLSPVLKQCLLPLCELCAKVGDA